MKKETQEVILSLAAAKDISTDAVVVMNLSELDATAVLLGSSGSKKNLTGSLKM